MKILAPVQNMQSLNAAIYYGADEVYLGIDQFNARNNIQGFTLETLKEAVVKAHLFGVKVNLAINILFTNEELASAVNTLITAYNLGVDAFIVQDLALASVISENYPEITLHASTQMAIHNLEGVLALKKFNFKRVVLARETPLAEIKRIKDNCDIEIEYFAHGALCVSFSGNCYLSSYLHDASGNRGRCKQLCRLPYTLLHNGVKVKKGYLLSAKDFCTIDKLKELKEHGVSVLKIEGRARRPFYVATAVDSYKKALNDLEYDKTKLKLAFNREFTYGYFDGNDKIISLKQNHIGIYLGKVLKVNNGKKFNEVIFESSYPLTPKSTLKVFDKNGTERCALSIFDLKKVKDFTYKTTTTQKIFEGDKIHLLADFSSEQIAENLSPKKEVKLRLDLTENLPIKATLNFDGINLEILGENLQKASNYPLTEKDILTTFNKSEFFAPKIEFSNFDKVFLSKQLLNDFRRKVYDKIITALTEKHTRNILPLTIKKTEKIEQFSNFEFTQNEDGIYSRENVIFSPEIYTVLSVKNFMQNCLKQGKKPYLDLPNFALENDLLLLREIIDKTGVLVVANNYYALTLNNVAVIGFGLNVYNDLTASILGLPYIPAEKCSNPFAPCMTLRHCPIKSHFGGDCKNCKYDNSFTYLAENGKKMILKRKKLSTCTFYLYLN